MGFFRAPHVAFDERPKLVMQKDMEQFRRHPGASLLSLNRLQELDLSACPKLTDSSITLVKGGGKNAEHKLKSRVRAVSPRFSSGGALPRTPPSVPLHAAQDH